MGFCLSYSDSRLIFSQACLCLGTNLATLQLEGTFEGPLVLLGSVRLVDLVKPFKTCSYVKSDNVTTI